MRWSARLRGVSRARIETRRPAVRSPDLASDEKVTLSLLNNDVWRSRVVEQVDIDSARVAHVRRSLQVAPLREFIDTPAPHATSAKVLLPLREMPKLPLLDFDISVDGRPAYLAKRSVIAEIEAAHFEALAREEGVQVEALALQFVAAICEFTPSIWRTFCRRLRRRSKAHQLYLAMGLRPLNAQRTDQEEPGETPSRITKARLRAFDWLVLRFPAVVTHAQWVDRPAGEPIDLPTGAYEHWCHHAQVISQVLALALHEGRDEESSADDPLLALPLLAARSDFSTVEDITRALVSLDEAVRALARAAEDVPSASPALRMLAHYGRRWIALVWCEVPLDRPFLVSSAQEVSISISRFGRLAIGPVPLADAASNHLAVHVKDGNVEMAKPRIFGLDRKHLTQTLATGLRKSREGFALYTSESGRDERVQLRLRLRVSRGISLVGLVIQAVVWVAAAVTYYRVWQNTLTAGDLAVLVVPSTFAASLLLTRERNSLARRLQTVGRGMAALATVALWVGVAYAYFGHHLAG